jgi:hypothetical protein
MLVFQAVVLVAALTVFVRLVIRVSAEIQVIRVYAEANVALVQNPEPVRDWSVAQNP